MSADALRSASPDQLVRGRLLARNTVINLVGMGAPFAVAAVCLPLIVRGVGLDRFGVMALGNAVVGYMGLFDLGLGRAATKFIAEALARQDERQIAASFWTAFFLMLVFGGIAALLLAAATPLMVARLLNVPSPLRGEAVWGFYIVAATLPFVISAGVLNGLLSSYQRFGLIAAVRIPSGVYSYASLLAVLPFSNRLTCLFAAIALGRLASWLALLGMCLRTTPFLRRRVTPERDIVGPMIRFGGWITVSGIIGPFLDYLDRFFVGAVLSLQMVSFYSVPYEVNARLRIIPGALAGVVFPAFSHLAAAERGRAARLFGRAVDALMLTIFPVALIIAVFAPEILLFWMGPDFAGQSSAALRWLMAALLINSVANVPFALVQACDRPDLTAKFHAAELVPFLLFLYWALHQWGVLGAAVAWTLRVLADTTLLMAAAWFIVEQTRADIRRSAGEMALCLTAIALGCSIDAVELRIGFAATAVLVTAFYGWSRYGAAVRRGWLTG